MQRLIQRKQCYCCTLTFPNTLQFLTYSISTREGKPLHSSVLGSLGKRSKRGTTGQLSRISLSISTSNFKIEPPAGDLVPRTVSSAKSRHPGFARPPKALELGRHLRPAIAETTLKLPFPSPCRQCTRRPRVSPAFSCKIFPASAVASHQLV